MLTPAGRSTATNHLIRPQATAPGTALRTRARLRAHGPQTIPGPHFHRASGDTTERPEADAQLPADSRLGFLAVGETPDGAFVGGYLVTNLWGRPLEFQCTAPVRPNRAQEVLFGPTLRPVLFGELIGATLIEKSSAAPALVLTDQRDVLSARPQVNVPIVCLSAVMIDASGTADNAQRFRADEPATVSKSRAASPQSCFPNFEHDALVFDTLLRSSERVQDLHEPFQRIHLCLEEVHP